MTSCSRVLTEWKQRNATHLPEKSGLRRADFENESDRQPLSFMCAWVSETLTILASLSMEMNFPGLCMERQETPECQAAGIFPLLQGLAYWRIDLSQVPRSMRMGLPTVCRDSKVVPNGTVDPI